ncbi:MAG: DUF3489 domain-containing protein [Pseudomonadota bacterium]
MTSKTVGKTPMRTKATEKTSARAATKLNLMIEALSRRSGASIEELRRLTGWQAHSVRGALAGALKKKGHAITSDKPDGGVRRYRIAKSG